MSKKIIRLAIITIVLLLIPFVAMRMGNQVDWSWVDFVLMGVLIFGSGLIYELIAKKSSRAIYKSAVAIGLLGGFLLLWVNGAVGIIGSEDNPINMMYFGVLLIGLIGAFWMHFKARGLAYTLLTVAVAQMIVPIIALLVSNLAFDPDVWRVFAINAFFAIIFAFSALLFREVDSSSK